MLEDQNLFWFKIANCYATTYTYDFLDSIVSNSSELEYLELVNLNLSSHNFSILFESLKKTRQLRHLVVKSINISTGNCADDIAYIIANNESLKHLIISNCNLNEVTSETLATALKSVKYLEYLDLSSNILSDSAAMNIACALSTMDALKHLDLSSTKLKEAGIVDIMRGLQSASSASLEYLSFNNCNITYSAAIDIASYIAVNFEYLASLRLSACMLEEASLICITDALTNLKSLCDLDLSYNTITDPTAINVAYVVTKSTAIKNFALSPFYTNDTNVPICWLSLLQLVDWNSTCDDVLPKSFNRFQIQNTILKVKVNSKLSLTHLTIAHCGCPEMFEYLEPHLNLEYLDLNSSIIPYETICRTIKSSIHLKHINISNCCWQQPAKSVGLYSTTNDVFYKISCCLLSLFHLEHINICGNNITNRIADVVAAVISKNKRLQHLDFSNCQMSNNGLTKILKSISSLNYLTYLDISFNMFSVNYIEEVIKMNRELAYVNLSNCILNTCVFDIKEGLPQRLRYLNLSKNFLKNKMVSTLQAIISSNVNLQHVDVSNCIMTKRGIAEIISSLKTIIYLKYINVSQCHISYSVGEVLVAAISFNEQLEHLNFSNCQLHKTSIVKILCILSQRSILKYLNLESNLLQSSTSSSEGNLPSGSVVQLATVITNNTFLEYINLSHCGLSGSDVTCITTALSELSYLQYFNISHNTITDEAAVGVASVITNNPSLEHFYMSNCCMEEYGVRKMAEALLVCKNLRTLDLNHITFLPEIRFWDIICKNTLMEYLSMPHIANVFNSEVAFSYFKLNHLNLGSNHFNSVAATAIASFINKAGLIKSLDMSNCNLSEDSLLTILSALRNIENLQYLNVASNKLTEKGESLIHEVIELNQMITTLILTDCGFTGDLLGDIILHCKSLEYLDISHNEISDEVANTIVSVITSRPSLEYLNISGCKFYEDGYQSILNVVFGDLFTSWSDDRSNSIVATVVSNYRLLVFHINNHAISETHELCKCADLAHYSNLRHDTISEKVQKFIISHFIERENEYLHFHNCDFNEYKICLILQAAKHVRTLQYFILTSNNMFHEILEDITVIISNNPTIKYLDLSDCELSGTMMSYITQNLANMSHLQYFDISDNEVTDKTGGELAAVITNNTSLEYLNVSNCSIQDIGLQVIGDALMGISSLISLDISSNNVTSETAKNVFAVVTSNNMLQRVYLASCFTNNELFTATFSLLPSYFKSLQHLDLQNNFISDWSADQLKFILTNSSVKHLNISQCVISNDGMNKILLALQTITTLESLILSSSKLTFDFSESFGIILKMNWNFKHVDLSNCGLSCSQVMMCISLALTPPSVTEVLNVSSNNFADIKITKNLENVRPCMLTNSKVKQLNMSSCKLPDVIMSYILLMLTSCTSLHCLNLHSCIINAGSHLSQVVANNPIMTHLNICGCNLEQKDIIMILRCFRRKDSIQYLFLSFNVIKDATAIEAASMISFSQLKQLALSGCKLTELGLLHITSALQNISTLQHLDLSYNIISDEAAVSIASALSNNISLEYLDLSYCTWSTNGLETIRETLDLKKFVMLREVDFTTQ